MTLLDDSASGDSVMRLSEFIFSFEWEDVPAPERWTVHWTGKIPWLDPIRPRHQLSSIAFSPTIITPKKREKEATIIILSIRARIRNEWQWDTEQWSRRETDPVVKSSINQSINWSFNQSVEQSIDQSIKQTVSAFLLPRLTIIEILLNKLLTTNYSFDLAFFAESWMNVEDIMNPCAKFEDDSVV